MSDSENEIIEEKVRQIKGFYINITIYVAVFLGCVIAWLAMGGGVFWPIWVLLGCGITAFSEGLRIGVFPVLSDIFPFLRDEWEENEKKRLLKHRKKPTKKQNVEGASSKKS